MITTKRPNTNDYTQVGFIEAKDNQGNYQNIDHIYDSQGNIVFQQGYLNEYDGADDFRIPAIGKPLLDYTIYGNTVQSGTPTPDNPVIPQGTGDRTGNLWEEDYTGISDSLKYVPVFVGEGTFTLSTDTPDYSRNAPLFLLSGNVTSGASTPINGVYNGLNRTTNSSNGYITIAFRRQSESSDPITHKTMLNAGSTALPYENFGYKIPISSAGQTTPVYLGEVQTTRKIVKEEILSDRIVGYEDRTDFVVVKTRIVDLKTAENRLNYLSSHFKVKGTDVSFTSGVLNNNYNNYYNMEFGLPATIASLNDAKAWFDSQKAAGTPVTIWYVLANEETAVVNEPLMRIGDYADSVNFSQASVQIPTLKRPKTTVIDITTSLPPSEVYAKYRGSKTQEYDLFLAANGDSFEARNGQSLYIGDDT